MENYSWHDDFYTRKVFPQICKDAGECTGFFAWLETADRQQYDELARLEQVINEIWQASGDREQFRTACRDWYKAVLASIDKWRVAMSTPKPPHPEPRQEKLL
jgi:hypothetical protein